MLGAVGFSDVRELRSFDPFFRTRKEKTARHFQVRGANVLAVKPA